MFATSSGDRATADRPRGTRGTIGQGTRGLRWPELGQALLVVAGATGLCAALSAHVAPSDLAMIYLLGVSFVASRSSPAAAIVASLLSVAAFDVCFVPPHGTFAVADAGYLITFSVMLLVALLIGTISVRFREHAELTNQATVRAQIEKARSDLFSGVSHDLRTPIANIQGSAEALLEQAELQEQSRQLATTILEESLRMGTLVQNLLDMTRAQHGIAPLRDWYGIEELADNAILRTRSLLSKAVTLASDPSVPLMFLDGVLMEQVFVNLLENAARHAGRDAAVTVTIAPRAGGALVAVDDDGPGIPNADTTRVFDRFVKAPGTRGSGLGLAICRAAVQAHGGTIWAERSPAGGARIAMLFPPSGANPDG